MKNFSRQVEIDEEKFRSGIAPEGVITCDDCRIPLRGTITGKHYLGDGACVCDDCYFERLGDEIDNHPIGIRK